MECINKIIAVDFDGTLFENKYPEIGAPIHSVIEYVKREQAAGNFLILWTCRCDEYLKAAVSACEAQGLIFDAINDNAPNNITRFGNNPRKVNADVYIDDKAMPTAGILSLTELRVSGGTK